MTTKNPKIIELIEQEKLDECDEAALEKRLIREMFEAAKQEQRVLVRINTLNIVLIALDVAELSFKDVEIPKKEFLRMTNESSVASAKLQLTRVRQLFETGRLIFQATDDSSESTIFDLIYDVTDLLELCDNKIEDIGGSAEELETIRRFSELRWTSNPPRIQNPLDPDSSYLAEKTRPLN